MYVLAEDIFDVIGRMTRLVELVSDPDEPETSYAITAKIRGLLLAGERERAIESIPAFCAEPHASEFGRELWQMIEADIAALCAQSHAREAENAKALKIEHIWEPSPFPVELPAAERTSVAEPVFSRATWISRPSWLLGEVPDTPGEVRFAKATIWRHGRTTLLVPLTREEAEQRHRDCEHYVTVALLSDGARLVIRRGAWDRNNPRRLNPPAGWGAFVGYHIGLCASSHSAFAWTSFLDLPEGFVAFYSIEVYRDGRDQSIWSGSFDLGKDERSIHDERSGKKVYSQAPLTTVERDLATFSISPFAEYADLVERMRSLLQIAGYGELS